MIKLKFKVSFWTNEKGKWSEEIECNNEEECSKLFWEYVQKEDVVSVIDPWLYDPKLIQIDEARKEVEKLTKKKRRKKAKRK